MNEKINKALQKIQFELGPYTNSHYENIFKNVKMYVVDGDATRDISFNVIVDETHCVLRINRQGVQFDSLPIGYTLMVNEERTVKLLYFIADAINRNDYGKEIAFPIKLIDEIYVCEKTPKLYTELELEKQIEVHVANERAIAEKTFISQRNETRAEHEAHLNAVIADIYTDMHYGNKRKKGDNQLEMIKRKNYSSERKIEEMVSPLHAFAVSFKKANVKE